MQSRWYGRRPSFPVAPWLVAVGMLFLVLRFVIDICKDFLPGLEYSRRSSLVNMANTVIESQDSKSTQKQEQLRIEFG